MQLRPFFRLLALALSLPVSLFATATAPTAGTPPNILFIAVDDLNDWIGPLRGHPQVKTPHLDRLAKRGITFTNAHCAAPLCNPSRAAVFSGLQPFQTGVLGAPRSRSAPPALSGGRLPHLRHR
jgi:arylsulfatase A-like enzyme